MNLNFITAAMTMLAVAASCNKTDIQKGLDAISEQEVQAEVSYLASDSLAGRQAGSEGSRLAAQYLIDHLKYLHIKPLNDDYRQWFECEPFDYVTHSAGIHNDTLASAYKTGNELCNVLAVIEGNNKNEFVIAGAHYDHVGSYPGLIEGDCIFNGADDNASGTVGLMQIASAFAAMETRPERTLILAFWDGEERNCKGSEYFLEHYADASAIKHCINLDMIGRGTADSIACICSDVYKDTYMKWVTDAITHGGLSLDVTTESEYVITDDSDQRPFALAGIPCLWFFTGDHADVHTPADEASKLDCHKIANTAKAVLQVLWQMCNE